MTTQATLFEPEARSGATISPCGLYRYHLWRSWGDGPTVNFVMLNPSRADATADDNTIRRCLGFARSWGYGTIAVTNLYAFRATDPKELWKAADPVGRDNDAFLDHFAARADLVVCAWGANARPERASEVVARLRQCADLTALRLTKDGHPCHPLRLPSGLTPVPMESPR